MSVVPSSSSPSNCGVTNLSNVDLVLYHCINSTKDCSDGLGAAFCIYKALSIKHPERKVRFIGMTCGLLPEGLELDKLSILMVDVSVPFHVLETSVLPVASNLLIIDHHEPVITELLSKQLDKKYVYYHKEVSGAYLAYLWSGLTEVDKEVCRKRSRTSSDDQDVSTALISSSSVACSIGEEGERHATFIVSERRRQDPLSSSDDDVAACIKNDHAPIPHMIQLISARDTWQKHLLSDVDAFYYGANSLLDKIPTSIATAFRDPYDTKQALLWRFAQLDGWLCNSDKLKCVIALGTPIVDMMHQMVMTACDEARIQMFKIQNATQERYIVAATIDVPGSMISDVGDALLKKHSCIDVAVMQRYYPSTNKTHFSFRSRKDGEDVSLLAQAYHHGHGHRSASGGRVYGNHLTLAMPEVVHAGNIPYLSNNIVQIHNEITRSSWLVLNHANAQRAWSLHILATTRTIGVSIVYTFEEQHIRMTIALNKSRMNMSDTTTAANCMFVALNPYHDGQSNQWELQHHPDANTVVIKASFPLIPSRLALLPWFANI